MATKLFTLATSVSHSGTSVALTEFTNTVNRELNSRKNLNGPMTITEVRHSVTPIMRGTGMTDKVYLVVTVTANSVEN